MGRVVGCCVATEMNEAEAEKIKARRTIRLLYALMVVFMAGPILFYFAIR
jgi:small neutral amino acid transporter SnatA (MarC family)